MLAQHTYRVKFNIGSVINVDIIRGFAQFQRNRIYVLHTVWNENVM